MAEQHSFIERQLDSMFIFITALTFGLLLLSTMMEVSLWYALIVSMTAYAVYAKSKGYEWKEILGMLGAGSKKALIVVRVFVFIGILTASWMISGTTPYLVYFGIQLMNPTYFYFIAFVLCCFISYLLGTSFGTISTIGVVLVAIASAGGLNLSIVAGAILSGTYFGDRASPMSSSLVLVSAVSDVEHSTAIKMALQTAIAPFFLTAVAFLLLSIASTTPMQISTELPAQILSAFRLSPMVLLPVIVILLLCVLKINAKKAMLASTVVAVVLALFLQKATLAQIVRALFFGFFLEASSPLYTIIKGGGIMSMLNAAIVVWISCSIAELIQKANLIPKSGKPWKAATRATLFLKSLVIACVTSAIGCNQSIAIILTASIEKEDYEKNGLSKEQLVKDVSITGSLIPVLFPWNIAVFIPIAMLGLGGLGYIPFLFYIYIMQLYHFGCYAVQDKKNAKKLITAE